MTERLGWLGIVKVVHCISNNWYVLDVQQKESGVGEGGGCTISYFTWGLLVIERGEVDECGVSAMGVEHWKKLKDKADEDVTPPDTPTSTDSR